MKTKRLICNLIFPLRLCAFALIIFLLTAAAQGQSTEQNFPTAIIDNQISGRINARDIGDARLTSYFYTFSAAQGDVFINVVTTNLNGDIDVFTADAALRPLTKITVYADAPNNETGRVIYLRQPTKLILRIEGRTPNDDAATFQIKFAGSFAPAENVAENPAPELPTVKSDNQTDVRVNSVGTIIEVKPKPTPAPKETIVAEKETEKETRAKEKTEIAANRKNRRKRETTRETAPTEKENQVEEPRETKPTVVVTDDLAESKAETEKQTDKNLPAETKKEKPEVKTEEKVEKTTMEKTAKTESKESRKPSPVKPLPPSALENIRLVILFKDGSKIERPMSEILKFGIEKGILTVISKDGSIGRYSILDVEKMTIE